jgi:hypothetical protein
MVLAVKEYGILDHLTEDVVLAKHDIEWRSHPQNVDLRPHLPGADGMIMDPAKMVL